MPADYKPIVFVFDTFKISSTELDSFDYSGLKEFETKVLSFAKDWLSQKSEFEFQTSGSTGTPRRITFNRNQIKGSVRLTQDFFQLHQNQNALLCLDPEFVAGKMMVLRALEIGMDLHCIPPIANPIEHLNATIDFAALVPYQLEAILNSNAASNINQIKATIIGGSPVSVELSKKLQSLPTQFYETYGMTETLTHIAIRKLNPLQDEFRVLPGIKIELDERNCLNIKADHLGNEVIQTNDVAELTGPDSFRIIGRYDNVINSAGVKISPETLEAKIESALKKILPDALYFIAGKPDSVFGEKVILLIETESLTTETKEDILTAIRSNLKKWEVPKEIIAIPHFKRTSSGKINRIRSIPN